MTLGVNETARLLEVHPNTVRNWTKQGILTDVRIQGSKQARYDEQDINRLATARQAPAFTNYERGPHQVAITVFVEAEGIDAHDASAGASMAISQALREASLDELQDMPTSLAPACRSCGLTAGLTGKGVMKSHYPGEHGPVRKPNKPCPGVGHTPAVRSEPVVGYLRMRDGLRISARVFQVMEAGMAAGNGYLWVRPTVKAFR